MYRSTFVISFDRLGINNIDNINNNNNNHKNNYNSINNNYSNTNNNFNNYSCSQFQQDNNNVVFIVVPSVGCTGNMDICGNSTYLDPYNNKYNNNSTSNNNYYFYNDGIINDHSCFTDKSAKHPDYDPDFPCFGVHVEQGSKESSQEFFAPNNSRRRRLKSLPGGRLYDWNTTHFFPDQHEVNVGLTFEVPWRKSFDGEKYFRDECLNSTPTYISVSREGSVAKVSQSNSTANVGRSPATNLDFSGLDKAAPTMPELESDEEDFTKVWQRSPVRRKKKDERPYSTEVRTDALPPKGSPHSQKKNAVVNVQSIPGRSNAMGSRSASTQAGSPKLKHKDQTEFLSKQGNRYEYKLNDEINYSEIKFNKPKTLSLENLDTADNNICRNSRPHYDINRKTTDASRATSSYRQDAAFSYLNDSWKRSGANPSASNKFDSIGSDESDYKVCAEEDKLRWQGYEIDLDGLASIGSMSSERNSVPPDDYVYVLKKVHRRPKSALDQVDRSSHVKEAFNHEKQIKIKSKMDLIPEQRYVIPIPESGVPRINNSDGHRDRHLFQNYQLLPKTVQSNELKSVFSGQNLSPEGDMFRNNRTVESASSTKIDPSHVRCEYKPPKAPRDSVHHTNLTDPGQSEFNYWQRMPPTSTEKRQYSGVAYDNGNATTTFGLTGYLTKPSTNLDHPTYNWNNAEASQNSCRFNDSHLISQTSGNVNRHSDMRRRPIADWMKLGNDFEQALMYGCFSDSSDAQNVSSVDTSIPSYYDDIDAANLAYPVGRQALYGGTGEMKQWNEYHVEQPLQRQEDSDAVSLIFEAIDQQNNYVSQSDSLRRSSVSEAIYSKPIKHPKRHKTQDRFDSLLFLDLHANPRLNIPCKGQDHLKIAKKATRPSSFDQPLKNTSMTNQYHGTRHGDTQSSAFKISCSLPGSRENIRRDSSSSESTEKDYGQFSIAEIKAKLFGPNEERASTLIQNNRQARDKLHSKSKADSNIYSRSIEAKPSYVCNDTNRKTFIHKGSEYMSSDVTNLDYSKIHYSSSSSDTEVDDDKNQNYELNSFGQKLKLQEVACESLGSLARKDLDDMASRQYKISNKWSARSNPDLSQKDSRNGSRVQTSYPRKNSRTTSKEKLSKSTQISKEHGIKNAFASKECRTDIDDNYRSVNFSFISPSKPKSYLARRQSLCTGVAKLVGLFEKSSSMPNLVEENLFVNSYSETGDLIDPRDGVELDGICLSAKPSKPILKQPGNKNKKSKKAKIRLLKSSDSGYIESETDSITSSGKDIKEKRHSGLESQAEGNDEATEQGERYDREKRWKELKQIREDWLNASPSQSPTPLNSFVSKKVLPLTTKAESFTKNQEFSQKINNVPYYERNCKVTSLGQSNYSAFARVTKPPQPTQKKSKHDVNENNDGDNSKSKHTKGMAVLTENVVPIPVMSKAEPILASKFPSGSVPLSTRQAIQNSRDIRDISKSNFSKFYPERFELSDDGNLTDCTDGTMDAILAHNQLCTLSPTSTLDCSDFEFYQFYTTAASLPPIRGSPKRGINIPVVRAESTGVKVFPKEPANVCPRNTLTECVPKSVEGEKRSIKELVDSFEVLLSNPFSSKPAVFT